MPPAKPIRSGRRLKRSVRITACPRSFGTIALSGAWSGLLSGGGPGRSQVADGPGRDLLGMNVSNSIDTREDVVLPPEEVDHRAEEHQQQGETQNPQ